MRRPQSHTHYFVTKNKALNLLKNHVLSYPCGVITYATCQSEFMISENMGPVILVGYFNCGAA
jgi:hypothetical protein